MRGEATEEAASIASLSWLEEEGLKPLKLEVLTLKQNGEKLLS